MKYIYVITILAVSNYFVLPGCVVENGEDWDLLSVSQSKYEEHYNYSSIKSDDELYELIETIDDNIVGTQTIEGIVNRHYCQIAPMLNYYESMSKSYSILKTNDNLYPFTKKYLKHLFVTKKVTTAEVSKWLLDELMNHYSRMEVRKHFWIMVSKFNFDGDIRRFELLCNYEIRQSQEYLNSHGILVNPEQLEDLFRWRLYIESEKGQIHLPREYLLEELDYLIYLRSHILENNQYNYIEADGRFKLTAICYGCKYLENMGRNLKEMMKRAIGNSIVSLKDIKAFTTINKKLKNVIHNHGIKLPELMTLGRHEYNKLSNWNSLGKDIMNNFNLYNNRISLKYNSKKDRGDQFISILKDSGFKLYKTQTKHFKLIGLPSTNKCLRISSKFFVENSSISETETFIFNDNLHLIN
ncbi:hypothetical protein O9G_003506 [Rozella allomycis CSF55]|uniref:Uncharacterized protein n=1 Tax=Rozella allomycis (strain CSF55) TaxID=988480 RepID=A0A075AYF6_ROZAC|nr:hypothetical protein O9G_003506 [Rozella allomycis CSF55]|eukprot:EPZ35134.1 hypothetical protein O9G_003506 [Rozella allomycis CSF55]